LLGLVVDDLSEEDKQRLGLPGGVIVNEVEEGPAAKAGVRGGDVILGLDGDDVNTVDDFRRIAGKLDTGRSTPILIRRGERSLFLALKPSE
jgi:serine protease Do